ncbi:MAG: hypothetical protein GY835_26445 [bacterium]|nr:hypothetical protein [bacterium]
MKKITLSILLILMASLAFAQPGTSKSDQASTCFAQGGPGRGGDGPPMGGPGFEGRAKEKMEAFRLFKMTEYLELTEDQTAKLFPRMAKINKVRDEFWTTTKAQLTELEELVKNDRIKKAANLANEIHNARWEHEKEIRDLEMEIYELFTGEQQARYILFQTKFRKHLKGVQQKMNRRHMDGPPPRRGPHGG